MLKLFFPLIKIDVNIGYIYKSHTHLVEIEAYNKDFPLQIALWEYQLIFNKFNLRVFIL